MLLCQSVAADLSQVTMRSRGALTNAQGEKKGPVWSNLRVYVHVNNANVHAELSGCDIALYIH